MTGMPQVCTARGCGEKPVARRLCRKHYQQAWKAGKLAAHTPTPKRQINRTVCPPDHSHGGTTVCYVIHQCRCDDCTDNRTAREAQRRKLKAYGRYDSGLVDVTEVREHVLMLGEFGIGYKRIAQLAGFKSSTPVRTIIWGRQDPGPRFGEMQKRVKRETAEKILAIQPVVENLAPGAKMTSVGTHRRLQALVVAGWSQSKLAQRLGVDSTNFTTLMRRNQVLASTHLDAVALFDELWDQAPPHDEWRDKIAYSRTLKFAKARRWLPALAWDDPDTDVEPPTAESDDLIDDMAVELALLGERPRLTSAERRECVRRLHRDRWSDGRIAEQIGCTDKTVLRIREELGLTAFDQNDLRAKGAA